MPEEEFAACEVCGRTTLRGEQLYDYVDPDGRNVGVCALCKARAEAMGWIPAELAATVSRHPPGRRRSRLRLRERLAARRPLGVPAAGGDARAPAPRAEPAASKPKAPARPARPPGPAPAPAPRPQAPRPALEVFNESAEPRKIAGLIRSLGAPSASVRVTPEGELITVAWELSWYQWRVSGGRVEEVGKGSELSQVAAEDQRWNATVGEDGRVSRV